MTATLTEHPDTRGSVSAPTLTFDDLEDGIDLITRLVADDDAAHARLHPDLQALDAAGLTITGKPAKRIRAALELVAYDYADTLSLDPKTALDRVWEHFHAGTTHRALWQAVADRRITARQAGTIRGQARRLDKRTAVVTVRRWAPAPVLDPDGNLIDVHLSEGDPSSPARPCNPPSTPTSTRPSPGPPTTATPTKPSTAAAPASSPARPPATNSSKSPAATTPANSSSNPAKTRSTTTSPSSCPARSPPADAPSPTPPPTPPPTPNAPPGSTTPAPTPNAPTTPSSTSSSTP